MPISESFTAAALSAGILTNIAADILEHHAQALEGTLAGRMLKWAGLIEPNFDDRLRDTLSKALGLYFETYSQYKLTGITAFFRDPAVARQIGGYILDRKPIDEDEIQQALDRHLGSDGVTRALIQRRRLEPKRIIPDFLECYRHVLKQQLTVPQMAILLGVLEQTDTLVTEIQASENRLKDFITQLQESKLSPEVLSAAYQTGQREPAAELGEPMAMSQILPGAGSISRVSSRQRLSQRRDELQSRWDDLTARIAAVQRDLGLETDSERRHTLKRRLAGLEAERDQVEADLDAIEQQLE